MTQTLKMDKAALDAFMAREFAQVADVMDVVAADAGGVTLRLTPDARHLRPGGTVSGPSMFMLADVAVYFAILSRIGPVALAVTTGAHIDFMRKPSAETPIEARAEVLKLGKRLAVCSVALRNAGADEVLAQAQMTYAIPPER
ncbi:PaaI family thioesterase [Celeribacter sp.]|uniref:PaaI family thioesterase n=1 Tax=Celeribacter sp. TaxID=1890673 RepID=UPI003A8FB0D8